MTQDSEESLHTPATAPRRPSRLRNAWAGLVGRPVTPDAIRAEWCAWQYELEALCDKLGAAANRLFTRDKRELDKALKSLAALELERDCGCGGEASEVEAGTPSRWAAKAALGRRYAAARGRPLPPLPIFEPAENGAADVDGAEAK